jgi:archaeal flagellar protein FlaJ
MPIGLILFVLPLPLELALHVTVALASIVIIPSIVAYRQSSERSGLEKTLPDFIRDVAEGRKIGLSPEGSIEQLSSKNYGRLSKSIKTMASQISWGLPILKVIKTFADSVDSWITMAIGTLMVEVVDVGGGTVSSFSTMADFTRKVNEIEADKKAALRSYIFVVYMAGIMLVMTTFMMVYFLSTPIVFAGQAASLPGVTITPATVQNLLTASIFDGWVIGFVAGKMGGGTVADGFKHALALVMVGGLMVALAPILLHHPL